jgi:transcription termination/antitermination protein NusA
MSVTPDPEEQIRQLFRSHIPEVLAGTIELVSVARDVGRRSYIAVRSRSAEVDPVGTCTGIRGARVKPMVDQLNPEHLTIVRWEESAERFIRNALTPLPISNVALDAQTREAVIAIDSARATESTNIEPSNVRLVSKLTGWNVTLSGVQE